MHIRCCRCGSPASSLMGYNYSARRVWLEDIGPAVPPGGYALCERHADRLTPPVAWTLTDARAFAPRLPFQREVA